jgi:hypothetical protein
MKLFVKVMLFVIVAALAAPFVIKGPDGRALMSLDRLRAPAVRLPDFSAAVDTVKAGLGEVVEEPAKPMAVFKWQDEKGVWHFSDKVEPGRSAQKLDVNPDANLVHFAAAEHSPPAASARSDDGDRGGPNGSPITASAPLGAISKLIGDAEHVDQLQKERSARQERATQD